MGRQLLTFFVERPLLSGVVVWGMLRLFKGAGKRRKPIVPEISEEQKARWERITEQQRPFSETMYDPPKDEL